MTCKKIVVVLFLLKFVDSFSQGDSKTYFDTYFDGLSYIGTDSTQLDIGKADSIFQQLFSSEKNQIEDIDYVIGRFKRLNLPINESYYKAQVRESHSYLSYKLQTNDTYRLSRSKFRKLKKTTITPKRTRKKHTLKLLWMLHKDQHSRKKGNAEKMNEIDSLNAIEVKKMLHDSLYIKELRYLNRTFLEIIIMHGGWNNYKDEIDLIHHYVDQRFLNRNFFADIFERKALGSGTLFKISEGKLDVCYNCSERLCAKNTMYPSNTGNRQYYINGRHVFVPFNPKLSIDELNTFRRYCFLPKYSPSSANERILFPTIAEWCLLNNYL